MKLTSEEKKARSEQRKIRIKQWWANLFATIKFVLRFAIVLGALLILDQAGGVKLVIYVFAAYIITVFIANHNTIKEMITDILIKLFG